MIQQVVKNNLCLECGACAALCPNNNINLERKNLIYTPIVGSNCSHCGICINACPGAGVDFKTLSKKFLKGKHDKYLGTFDKTFLGFSKDKNIRQRSSSGGIITSLCLYLIENKIVDGAIVVRSKDKITNQAYIAENKKQLLQSLQSRYIPTPIFDILNKLEPDKRYVFVGSPCHIHSIRKTNDKKLKDNIILTIAHFCEYNPHPHYLEFFAKKSKINFKNIRSIKYREGNWPGNLVLTEKNGKKHTPFKQLFFPATMPFIRNRCLLCLDHTGELADISVGDAWSLGLDGKKGGWSIFISRTPEATRIINKAKARIHSEPISKDQIIRSQEVPLRLKKDAYSLRKINPKPDYKGYEKQYQPDKEIIKINNQVMFLIKLRRSRLINLLPKSFFDLLLKKVFEKVELTKE